VLVLLFLQYIRWRSINPQAEFILNVGFARRQWYLRIFSAGILTVALILTFTASLVSAEETWKKSLAQGNDNLTNQNIFQAEKCFKQAVNEIRFVPHTAEEKARCLTALANTLALENKTTEAAAIYQQSLETLETTYGKKSIRLTPPLFALGSLYESAGDHRLAMDYYNRAIGINEKHFGPYSPEFANWLPSPDRASNSKDQLGVRFYKESPSVLRQQSGLGASRALENLLPSYHEDLLKKEDTSDQDLISGFQSEIAKTPIGDVASGKIATSSNARKQQDVAKPLNRM
jgi:tetratricopeptide (TPR) repeat protein